MSIKKWVIRTKSDKKEDLVHSIRGNRQYALSKDEYSATMNDNYQALAITIRDRIVENWIATQQRYHNENSKRVYYLSLEFLMGRLMGNNIYSLGLEEKIKEALEDLGFDIKDIFGQEPDAGLGNGGLGRLAACFLDSMATLGIPAHGYGIRYDYGIFEQEIKNGVQKEHPDEWLKLGSPWEFPRLEYEVPIKFYGKVSLFNDEEGGILFNWTDTEDVLAVPYDIPIPGYKNEVVNTLRLWSARSTNDFDFQYFNNGDYEQAVFHKIYSENISKVLYPNDQMASGQELRLKQEYFFVAASLFDILRRFQSENEDLRNLSDKVVIQLNDTHPAMAVAELMRLLIDKNNLSWDDAWAVVSKTFAYTNHTLMPEALEKWPVTLIECLLPRHLQIINEINYRFLEEVAKKFPGDSERLSRMSIIQEGSPKQVRMAHLAIVGSFSVNGVSALHSDLLKSRLLKDFYEFYPEKFNNKTNGITQRRWLLSSNPSLSDLIADKLSDHWVSDLSQLKQLEKYIDDKNFLKNWEAAKLINKKELVKYIEKKNGIIIDEQSLFDVQVKRIHEYKRQLLFAFYMIHQYLTIKNNPKQFIQPRTFMVGGKAAPGYFMAKLIIKFINNVAQVINNDQAIRNKIKVVFLENYCVSLAEMIIPASDLSEQISTAGTEASGTGNMKFMLNGALTIGTYDGANIEMTEQVGEDNIFIFGLRSDEVESLQKSGYVPNEYIHRNPILEEIFQLIKSNYFSSNETDLFMPIYESLVYSDPYLICADFESYCQRQEDVSKTFLNQEIWTKKSILNVARAGLFSSDRTIQQYADEIWNVQTRKSANRK